MMKENHCVCGGCGRTIDDKKVLFGGYVPAGKSKGGDSVNRARCLDCLGQSVSWNPTRTAECKMLPAFIFQFRFKGTEKWLETLKSKEYGFSVDAEDGTVQFSCENGSGLRKVLRTVSEYGGFEDLRFAVKIEGGNAETAKLIAETADKEAMNCYNMRISYKNGYFVSETCEVDPNEIYFRLELARELAKKVELYSTKTTAFTVKKVKAIVEKFSSGEADVQKRRPGK